MRIYTRRGDDGSTGLFHGGRVAKDEIGPEAYGTVDETVSVLGVARASADAPVAEQLLAVQRQLFVVAAELATNPANRNKLEDKVSRVDQSMVDGLTPFSDFAYTVDSATHTGSTSPGPGDGWGTPTLAAALDRASSCGYPLKAGHFMTSTT